MKKSMTKMAMVALIAGTSGAALASDFSAEFVGRHGVIGGVTVDGAAQNAGSWGFEYTSAIPGDAAGQFATTRFFTFCIELQPISGGDVAYDIGDISSAPNPVSSNGGVPYGEADSREVQAVVAAAMRLDWINSDLSANTATDSQLAAIQGMIWSVLFDGSTVAGVGDVATWMSALAAETALDPTARIYRMRAMTSMDSQDQLYIVPLPPAAFAGLATLGAIAGVARIRRNRA